MNIPRLLVPLLLVTCALATAKMPDLSKAPDQLVKDLYAAAAKNPSMFPTDDRKVLEPYFAKQLTDLLVKDAKMAKNEVGAIDFDLLYDSQDPNISNFKISPATVSGEHALIPVTFTDSGNNRSFTYSLIMTKSGWRISNIKYGDKRALYQILTAAYDQR